MKKTVQIQLSFMMFLEFFIWGGWFVSLGTFLHHNLQATGDETAQIFSTQSWGAIIAPFIIGIIADRYFNAEKILGLLHLIGSGLMYLMSQSQDVATFYPYVFVYMIIYMPTLALVNSVAFNQMKNATKEFSIIRVFGTIGWIIAGLIISVFSWDSEQNVTQGMLKNTFLMTAIMSFVMGIFSFTLPKTPPKRKKQQIKLSDILGLEALGLLKDRNFLIFFSASIFICIPLAFYYQYTHLYFDAIKMPSPTGIMSIGQMSEAFCLLLLPYFFKRFGFKKTIMVGMLAWAIRYVLFAYGSSDSVAGFSMLILGIALHGICYDFFFVSGQIYTNFKAGDGIKSAAQGMITLATYGVGMLIGFYVAGKIADAYTIAETKEWEIIWMFPVIFASVIYILFATFFKNEKIEYQE